jgi:hypothetical protein
MAEIDPNLGVAFGDIMYNLALRNQSFWLLCEWMVAKQAEVQGDFLTDEEFSERVSATFASYYDLDAGQMRKILDAWQLTEFGRDDEA